MKLFGGSGGAREEGGGNFFASALKLFETLLEKKAVRITVIVLAVLGVAAIGTAAWWNLTVTPPELPAPEPPDTVDSPTFDMAEPVKPVSSANPDSNIPTLFKEGCYTVALIGLQGNGDLNTDTMMVGRLDTVNKTLNVMSIPRDTMVNVKRGLKKINAAYAMSYSKGKDEAVQQLLTEMKSILGFKPSYYAIVNMDGFVKLVNAMDGVTYDVPQNMYKNTGDMVINLRKGVQKLTGEQALQLVRYRGYAGKDDYGRMETQQGLLKAIAKQLISLGNVFKINDFVSIAKENLQTNLGTGDMLWFGQELLSYGADNITFCTLPTSVGYYHEVSYVYVNEAEAVELINETINPYTRDITEDDLDILILKG